MSVVRIEALRALERLIELRIPELAGHVCIDEPGSAFEEMPNVSIIPSKWTFVPEQADDSVTLPGNVVVWNVGQHECPCVLSVLATSKAQRWELEAKLLDLFLSSRHPLTDIPRPGILVLPVTACPQLSQWLASFELESDEWNDTLAQDHRYESRIVLTAIIPALTVQTPVYTIEQLILGITEDMTTTFTPATAIPPAVELVSINEDGSISTFEP